MGNIYKFKDSACAQAFSKNAVRILKSSMITGVRASSEKTGCPRTAKHCGRRVCVALCAHTAHTGNHSGKVCGPQCFGAQDTCVVCACAGGLYKAPHPARTPSFWKGRSRSGIGLRRISDPITPGPRVKPAVRQVMGTRP